MSPEVLSSLRFSLALLRRRKTSGNRYLQRFRLSARKFFPVNINTFVHYFSLKDAQIKALEEEKAELVQEIDEMKSSGYKQTYMMEEMQKDKEDIVAKMTAYQDKYRRLEDEKEHIRKELLIRNATDNMTNTYIKNLRVCISNDFIFESILFDGSTLIRHHASNLLALINVDQA